MVQNTYLQMYSKQSTESVPDLVLSLKNVPEVVFLEVGPK